MSLKLIIRSFLLTANKTLTNQNNCFLTNYLNKNNQHFLSRTFSTNKQMDSNKLNKDEVARYSRQMLLPEIGAKGQLRMKSKSVLIVGAGGLGCPSSLYLAAAGIGRIGFVDNDIVETNNLHRQTLHSEATIGKFKTDSAVDRLQQLNSNVKFDKHPVRLSAANAMNIIENYDIVMDCTDNPMTRYLVSDVCVLLKKPMISGSALRFEGQLTTYNYDEKTPCYRCLFPNPPVPGTVTNCSDGGVLGVVPGIIGNLQALEAIKIAAGLKPSFAGILFLFDGLRGDFRTVTLRNRQEDCISCGNNPTITNKLMDYESFCGIKCDSATGLRILAPEERITVQEYENILNSNEPHLLIDVRPQLQQDIVKLDNAYSIPLSEMVKPGGMERIEKMLQNEDDFKANHYDQYKTKKIFMICRRGNASQKAVREAKKYFTDKNDCLEIKDIIGGMEKWTKEIDPEMPMY